jgi:hypothetical protein
MNVQRHGVVGLAIAACVLLLPAQGWAQQSGIAGAVRDASGGALPGVTVEASSPALIEGTRTVVTDGGGLYNFVDLRPGSYTVVFTLPGFSTLRREGVELSAISLFHSKATMIRWHKRRQPAHRPLMSVYLSTRSSIS